ncbi:MAG: TetR/AcrR family transcriptional regulator [Gemmatimonadetes bacterium]|nr:TetR/AcrR family transcriptional regulator [Gemmatimonadota bacterium]
MAAQRPYHHGNLRDAVLAAARTMVSTEGTTGLSLRALARQVGVSHPAIYSHFADRQALLAELSTEALLALGRSQRHALAKSTTSLDGVVRLGAAYFRFGVADPGRLRLAFAPEFAQSAGFPALRAAADSAEAPVLEAVTRAANDGLLPHDEIRQRALAQWALVHGFTILAIDGRLTEGRLSVSGAGFASLQRALAVSVRLLYGTQPS